MNVIKAKLEDIEVVIPIAFSWKKICNSKDMGIDIVNEVYLAELIQMVNDIDKELLLLINNDKIVGYMGLFITKSPVGNQVFANEHFLYVLEGNGSEGGKLLINEAKLWAKDKGCSHLILNASNLASSFHDTVCKIYERIGMKKFETSYITEIQ